MSINSSVFQATNISEDQNRNMMDLDDIPLSIVIIQLSILSLGIIANVLLIFSHWKDPFRFFNNTTSLFVRNIAIIDIIVAVVWNIRTSVSLSPGRKPEIIRIIWLGFTAMSPCTFLCFAIERFLSVAFPLWYRVRVTIQTCRKVLLGTWIAHVAIQTIAVFVFNVDEKRNFILCYATAMFLSVYIFYFATYISLRRQRNELRKRQNISEGTFNAIKGRQEQEKRFLITIAVVCIILMIVFLPAIGMRTLIVLLSLVRTSRIYSALLILLSINYLINPIIYLIRLPRYRKTFKKLYCNFM